jgi:DNA-binding Xre family transcriptional regulator
MLTLHLGPIFTARDIDSPYSFLKRNGFSSQMVRTLLSGERTNISLKHVERLCELLWCEPNDLLLWQPASDEEIPEEHPLHPLLKKDWGRAVNARKLLAKVPLKKLQGVAEQLNKEVDQAIKGKEKG